MYYNGEGVRQDYVQSHMWFDLAAARAETGRIRVETTKNRDIVARRLSPAQIAEARLLAHLWRPQQQMAVAVAAQVWDADLRRQLVIRIQRGLAAIGYGHGTADGLLGRRTRSAIRAFQSREGLPVTGRISKSLEAALRKATPPFRTARIRPRYSEPSTIHPMMKAIDKIQPLNVMPESET
jgi:hypothetical protein